METYILIFAFSALVLCILIWMCLDIYAQWKTKELKKTGFGIVFYLLDKANSISYFREKEYWVGPYYKKTYHFLESNKNKWFVRLSGDSVIPKLVDYYKCATEYTERFGHHLSLDHYFTHSESEKLKQIQTEIINRSEELLPLAERIFNDDSIKQNKIKKYKSNCIKYLQATDKRGNHNLDFISKELEDNKDYFDKVLKYPLDSQQRLSIVKLEDNCLVISSAGSGKTSTSIAKVKYLLEKRRVPKNEILVLSYNRKTAEEFQKRLDIPELACKTFHALSLSIIGEAEGKRPTVCEPGFLLKCFYDLVKNEPSYKKAIVDYIGEKASITKNCHEYPKSEFYYKDRETYGIMAPYGDKNGSAIFTKSEEEKKICTWLSTHGVQFLYEKPYPIETADQTHRTYKPDFTIYFTKDNIEYYLFLEHFGIDKNGNVPSWFGEGRNGGYEWANREYNLGIQWKRSLHKKNHTILIETTSAMFHDGTVYQKLEEQLRSYGVPTQELSNETKFKMLFERNATMEENVMNLFTSYINLMKSNGKTFDSIYELIRTNQEDTDFIERCRYLMYEVIKPLYDYYQKTMKLNDMMDFTDIILHAANLCASKQWKSPYSYILVDEFQDISVDRYKLLCSLRREDPLTKLYCVGDDWQSIYRFSGSDMNLFNKYEEYFGYTEKCKIETTYRFGNPLIDRSSDFILKNPAQVKKKVVPFTKKCFEKGENGRKKLVSKTNTTDISLIPFERGERNAKYLETIRELLKTIPANESIMLLGRYNYEANVFPKNCIEETANTKRLTIKYADREMNFMSVHASKGLEADHVIILNCSQDGGGFPSRVSDDPILGYVLSEIDSFEYSEERRLFYVAITRAKKHTYIMYNSQMASTFVNEILEQSNNDILRCPLCKKGSLKIVKDAVAKSGSLYRNYLCNNSISGCNFFWRVYYNNENDLKEQYHAQMDKFFPTRKKDTTNIEEKDGTDKNNVVTPPTDNPKLMSQYAQLERIMQDHYKGGRFILFH